jgi:hypothetical protein
MASAQNTTGSRRIISKEGVKNQGGLRKTISTWEHANKQSKMALDTRTDIMLICF